MSEKLIVYYLLVLVFCLGVAALSALLFNFRGVLGRGARLSPFVVGVGLAILPRVWDWPTSSWASVILLPAAVFVILAGAILALLILIAMSVARRAQSK